MGWGYGRDRNDTREIGYTVPATCDHPGCDEKIDRGIAYSCGNAPWQDLYYCDGYFCMKHLTYPRLNDWDFLAAEKSWGPIYNVCVSCSKDLEEEWSGKGDEEAWWESENDYEKPEVK